jgi:hypothetical protein
MEALRMLGQAEAARKSNKTDSTPPRPRIRLSWIKRIASAVLLRLADILIWTGSRLKAACQSE